MKKFLLKILLILFITVFPSFLILFTMAPQFTHVYNASFIDKIERLESIQEPKIVLVSNSNLAFGIQSDLLEKELNMPVVNLGLHGGLGNAFHERMPLFNLTEGDIIVISHLDYSDDDSISDPVLALITVENYFHYWKIFRLKDIPRIVLNIPQYSIKCLIRFLTNGDKEPIIPTCYSRSSFNQYGDNIYPRNIEAGESAPYLRHPEVNDVCMNRINSLYEYCSKKGATVVISGAPIICGLDGFNLEEYEIFQKKVEEKAVCPIISDFTDYIFDKKYFFGSSLHMTNDGAVLRTEQLIKDLKIFLAK